MARVAASARLGVRPADGAPSIAIGFLLVADRFVIAQETCSLIAGESVAPTVMDDSRRALAAVHPAARIAHVATLLLGRRRAHVAVTLECPSPDAAGRAEWNGMLYRRPRP